MAEVVAIKNECVITARCNRFGAGLDISDVHSILEDITEVGFDLELWGVPVCFELPDGDEGQREITFNEGLVDGANGFLAPVDADVVTDISLMASHRSAA